MGLDEEELLKQLQPWRAGPNPWTCPVQTTGNSLGAEHMCTARLIATTTAQGIPRLARKNGRTGVPATVLSTQRDISTQATGYLGT